MLRYNSHHTPKHHRAKHQRTELLNSKVNFDGWVKMAVLCTFCAVEK